MTFWIQRASLIELLPLEGQAAPEQDTDTT